MEDDGTKVLLREEGCRVDTRLHDGEVREGVRYFKGKVKDMKIGEGEVTEEGTVYICEILDGISFVTVVCV